MKKEKIGVQTRVRQRKQIYLSDLDEDKVMMDLDTGNYFVLNEVGNYIWESIQKEKSVQEIVEELMNSYEVSKDICMKQVIGYLNQLYAANLIILENA